MVTKCFFTSRITCLLISSLIALSLAHPAYAQTGGAATFDETNALRATVLITQVVHSPNGDPVISCVGSGTLISADGLILTNAHLAQSTPHCKADAIAISLTGIPGQPPVATYYAELNEVNIGWDLAVLQITRTLDGRAIDRSTLSLPYVSLGDSEALHLDDTIEVVGYPSSDDKQAASTTTNSAASVRRGVISNFTDEARVGSRAWIKTNATISGGMSGGAAYNTAGQLIGVPTIEASPGATEACRLIQDTNGDGRVDSNDSCVPTGGFINALRPSRLARGLVRAAQLRITINNDSSGAAATSTANASANGATFTRLFFAPGINAAGMPTSVITTTPGGTKSLYLFFDYRNMYDGLIYELRATIDGVPNATFSLAPSTWNGGVQGMWYIGGHEQVWPNGVYLFTLLIEGVRAASKQITIGGAASTAPSFSDILFGVTDRTVQISVKGELPPLIITGNVLPASDQINAEFVYNNVPPNTPWQQAWYYQDVQITSPTKANWKSAANGKQQISAASPPGNPLQPGRYRVELYLGDQLAATSDFVMAGDYANSKLSLFNGLTFASDVTGSGADAKITGAGLTFANTIPRLFATFDWANIAPGTPWTWRWAVDGNPLFEETQPWQGALSGKTAMLQINGQNHLPDGSYSVELLVGGVSMGKATAKVGLGQLPVNIFAQVSGVQVQGKVIDAETKQPIVGAALIVLKQNISTKDFTGQMADIDQMALTDSQGQFQLTRLLPRGNTYSVIVRAAGYLPLSTDALTFDDKTKNPLVMQLEMNKD